MNARLDLVTAQVDEAMQRMESGEEPTVGRPARLDDFYAYMPGHTYIYEPTRELWPAASVNGRVQPWPQDSETQKRLKPADWLDRNRPVEQMVWDPSKPMLIKDQVMQIAGYVRHMGATVFNLYRPPTITAGRSLGAKLWRDHLRAIYPQDADHIEKYLAFKVQRPGVKINHAIVLGGSPGIGKDTILQPVRDAVGPWNCSDITPGHLLRRFNGYMKCVMLIISEARDLGEMDRYALYEHSKTILAAPPDVIRVDEKNLREHYVLNVCGVAITTNHKLDGLYLPADDRRHYVAWSEATREQFDTRHWESLYRWYEDGGTADVVGHLLTLDVSDFNPKEPPLKTPAFWAMVQANEAPESGELRDVIEEMGSPAALTTADLIAQAESLRCLSLAEELRDRRNRRSMPHKLERVGYVPVRNPDAEDGLFKVNGKRQTVYAAKALSVAEQIKAARSVSAVG